MDLPMSLTPSSLLWSTCLAVVLLMLVALCVVQKQDKSSRAERVQEHSDNDSATKLTYVDIQPIKDFSWRDEEPIALRPFRAKYNLTMAIENMTLSELVAVDRTYLNRIHLRRDIMQQHPSTIGQQPCSETAINEFYTWMVEVYLPQRFPDMYTLKRHEKEPCLVNLTTSESIPLTPFSTRLALQTLGAHNDTDFLFLMPCRETGKYHLEAFVTTFPSGFSTMEKLGLPLAAIHKPVPGYEAKLARSMDRFFANIPVGKIVKRANWTVTTNDTLYSESGTHLYEGQKGAAEKTGSVDQDIQRQKDEIVIENCRLRCERQTLHRLPETKALVFAFKTYQYTLAEVKEDGSGPELAAAIEGLGLGNVPEMKYYKRGIVWGDKVREYLLN